jgi:hypothetical protein
MLNHGIINETKADVFVYTAEVGAFVPRDVVRVRVDPSVTSIPANAFQGRTALTEAELCEGLVEIGVGSFRWCSRSITKINIPNSLRRINDYAFSESLRCPIHLHDDIESIGDGAFSWCIFTNFRVPPLITVIPERMLNWCKSMFSLEIPEDLMGIGYGAFFGCYYLRNVAFPPNAVIGNNIFIEEDDDVMPDLQRLFGNLNANIIWELQHRFDGLLIHQIVYYQSYSEGVLQRLIAAINMRSGQHRKLRNKLDTTGNQQDCLGMTPLHILACSSVHDLELYRVIIENYPANLITEDRWGALPLLYAFWGAAPAEIIEFLLESYQTLYPGHVFNWTMMVETMGRCDTSKEIIENLLHVKQMHFPEQPIDWGYLLDKFANDDYMSFSFSGVPFQERMQFLFMCGLSERVEALAFKVWRYHITNMIQATAFQWRRDNFAFLHRIQDQLTYFDDKLPKLKEITTILELALWKIKINEKSHGMASHYQKKIRVDQSEFRRQCRVTCGASVVIGHVLPFLL